MRFILGCIIKCAAPGARATRAATDATSPAIRRVHGLAPGSAAKRRERRLLDARGVVADHERGGRDRRHTIATVSLSRESERRPIGSSQGAAPENAAPIGDDRHR
jgi:hypothetical protein